MKAVNTGEDKQLNEKKVIPLYTSAWREKDAWPTYLNHPFSKIHIKIYRYVCILTCTKHTIVV